MEQTTNKMNDLITQLETAKKQIKTKEEELTQAEEALKKAEEVMKEAEFQDILKIVEDKLVPLFQKERENENQISSSMNNLFKKTAQAVKKINLMYKDLSKLKKKIKNTESQIIQNGQQNGFAVREAIELKKVQAVQDLKVIKQIKGASSLAKQVNMTIGAHGGVYEGLLEEDFGRLPVYAQNIYDSVKRAAEKSLRAQIDDLIRISRIPEPRIILAREMVIKFLDKLKENKLIKYSLSGDTYIITDRKA